MQFEAYWEIFSKFLWPLILVYATYLHRELTMLMQKLEKLQEDHYDHKTEAHRNFATRAMLGDIKTELASMLNRIDDKVTRILEERK